MSFAGVDIKGYKSLSPSKAAKKSYTSIHSDKSDVGPIRAWRNGSNDSTNDNNSSLTSRVDRLLSSTNISTSKPATTKSPPRDIKNRLYKSELQRDEAEAKLSQWMNVARELQDIVRQQQFQLMSHTTAKSHNTTSDNTSPSSHIAQLQQLVRTVRSELNKTIDTEQQPSPSTASTISHPSHSNTDNVDAARLQTEIQSLRQKVHHLQQQQQSSSMTIMSKNDDAGRVHACTRNALMDAEMDLQKATQEIASLRQRLVEYEALHQTHMRELASSHSETERVKEQVEMAEQRVKAVLQEKADISRKIDELTAEIGSLQSICAQKDARVDAAMQAAHQANSQLTEAQCKATAAEASEALERSKRSAIEGSMARLQSEVLSLESQLADLTRRSKSEAAAYAAQIEAFDEELAKCQHDARAAKREADAAREERATLQQAHAFAVEQAQSMQEKLREVDAEREAAVRRAVHAEKEAAATLAAASERDAALDAEKTLHHETEIRGMKEVLDRVAASAQAKDAALEQAQARFVEERSIWEQQHATLMNELHAYEHRVKMIQAAAAEESQSWNAELVRLQQRYESHIASLTPVTLDIRVKDNNDDAPHHVHADTINQLQWEYETRLKTAIAEEQKEHAAALHALEEAHVAALQQAREDARQEALSEFANAPPSPPWEGATAVRRKWEEAEAEAALLREEVATLKHSIAEQQSQLRASEAELLSAQSKASQMNSAIEKLRNKCKKYKEELASTKKRLNIVEESNIELKKQVDKAEEASAALKTELSDAQDEVEALLTARLHALSRPTSEVDPMEENDDYVDEDDDSGSGVDGHHHGYNVHQPQQQQQYGGDGGDGDDDIGFDIDEIVKHRMQDVNDTLHHHFLQYNNNNHHQHNQQPMEEMMVYPQPHTTTITTAHQQQQYQSQPNTPREEYFPEQHYHHPQPQKSTRNRSPLKKLANLLRGRKPNAHKQSSGGRYGSAGHVIYDDEEQVVDHAPLSASVMNLSRSSSGVVSQMLTRNADGRVEWRLNAGYSYSNEGEERMIVQERKQQQYGDGNGWRENDLYKESSSYSQEDLEY